MIMKREIIRVEPLSTYLERWTASTSAGTRHGDTVYVSITRAETDDYAAEVGILKQALIIDSE